ncbi:MAG: HIRAN domain-containing protein [Burkholderiales bacterium]
MKSVFLAWQDSKTRGWTPIGRLSIEGRGYRFYWTKAARTVLSDLPLPDGMKNTEYIYESDELFPFFANRLLNPNRPEFRRFVKWLALEGQESDALSALAISGGERGTDPFEIFPEPERTHDGKYEITFFSHGLRHLPPGSSEAIERLQPGDRLYLLRDVQNAHDQFALALRTDDPPILVGYCPRYFAHDICKILDRAPPSSMSVNVHRVNKDAPPSLRLLCRLVAPWPADFVPFSGEDFEPAIPLDHAPRNIWVTARAAAMKFGANADLSVSTGAKD